MPLLSSNPDAPNGPIFPGGDPLEPFVGLDPSQLIEGLNAQQALKAKQWKAQQTYDRPDMPEIWKEGLPSDVGYMSDTYNRSINEIEQGIRDAGGNARYYLGTDAGKTAMRRAALDPEQMSTMFHQKQAYDKLEERVSTKDAGQELWMNRYGNPMVDPRTGQPATINQMMLNYRGNDAYSPFYNPEGSQRDLSQTLTTFGEAREEVEQYFNSVKPDTYGTTEFTGNRFGLPGLYEEIRRTGFSSIESVKSIMAGGDGLHNNLSKSAMAGFSRGFNDKISMGGSYEEQGYVDPETKQFTEKYSIDKQQWIFDEIARIAREKMVQGHDEDINIKAVPGGGGGSTDQQGFNKWDQFVLNEAGVAGDLDPVTQVYMGTTGVDEYQRTAPENMRRYDVSDSPLHEKYTELIDANTKRSAVTGDGNVLPTVKDLLSNVQYAWMKSADGTNEVMDLTGTFGDIDASDLIVYNISNVGEEHYKPGLSVTGRGARGQVKYGPMSLRNVDGEMVIDHTALGNLHPNDVDRSNETANHVLMEVLYPSSQFVTRKSYSEDFKDGKLKYIEIGTDYAMHDPDISERFAGIGGHKKNDNYWQGSSEEVNDIEVDGVEYTKITIAVPTNSSHAGYGATDTYQEKHNAGFQGQLQQATRADKGMTQSVIEILQQNYQNFENE